MVKKVGHGAPVTKAHAATPKKLLSFKALAQKVTAVAQNVGFGAGWHDYSKQDLRRGESRRAESLFQKTTGSSSRKKTH